MQNTNIYSFEIYKKRLAENIKSLLELHSMNIGEFSRKLKISYGSLYSIIQGNSNPQLGTLYQIAEYFNLDISNLIEDKSIFKEHISNIVPIIELKEVLNYVKAELNNQDINNFIIISTKQISSFKKFAIISDMKTEPLFKSGTILIFEEITSDLANYDNKYVLIITNNVNYSLKKLCLEGNNIYLQSTNINIEPQKITENIQVISYLIEARQLYN